MRLTNLIPNQQVKTLIIGRSDNSEKPVDQINQQFPSKQVIQLNQQHTNRCVILRDDESISEFSLTEPADAVISNRFDIALIVRTADCLPILLYHPSGIIGAIHAGRKGTQLGVLSNTLSLLKAELGIEKNVILWFGPAICKDCYQIDREANLRYDLRAENKRQAEKIFPSGSINIIENEHCTFHNNSDWYSYRKEGKGVINNISIISL